MVQSSFRRGELSESIKNTIVESDERTEHVLHEVSDCRETIRRSRKLLTDSYQSLTGHAPYQHLTREQVLELYDKATSRFLRTRDAESRRDVIELHQLLQRLK